MRGDVNGIHPIAIAAPKDADELIRYVEWAAPRARLLGTRLTVPEQRSIGFMHALHREAKAIEARKAAEIAAAAETARDAGETNG